MPIVLRLARPVFWLLLLLTFYFAFSPHPACVNLLPNDKWQHALAFFTLTIMCGCAYPRLKPLPLALAMIALGGMIEIVQLMPILRRDSSLSDWSVDIAAIVLALPLPGVARTVLGKCVAR